MMNYLQQSKTRFDALQQRERILLLLAAVVLVYFLVNVLLLAPEQKKQKALQQQITAQQMELAATNAAMSQMSGQVLQSPLAQEQATRDSLEKTINEADALLGQTDATSPQVGALLKATLETNPGLTLVSLKTLPVTTFFVANAAPAAPAGPVPDAQARAPSPSLPIYRHGVEISIKGNYLALLPYLENLQKYPKRLFWYDAKLDVAAYPAAILTMTIYTLSEQSSSPLG